MPSQASVCYTSPSLCMFSLVDLIKVPSLAPQGRAGQERLDGLHSAKSGVIYRFSSCLTSHLHWTDIAKQPPSNFFTLFPGHCIPPSAFLPPHSCSFPGTSSFPSQSRDLNAQAYPLPPPPPLFFFLSFLMFAFQLWGFQRRHLELRDSFLTQSRLLASPSKAFFTSVLVFGSLAFLSGPPLEFPTPSLPICYCMLAAWSTEPFIVIVLNPCSNNSNLPATSEAESDAFCLFRLVSFYFLT